MPKVAEENIKYFIDISKFNNEVFVTIKLHSGKVEVIPESDCPGNLLAKYLRKTNREADTESYEIKSIKKFNGATNKFLVAWDGIDAKTNAPYEDSEEPIENFVGDLANVKRFAQRLKGNDRKFVIHEIQTELRKRIRSVKKKDDESMTIASGYLSNASSSDSRSSRSTSSRVLKRTARKSRN